MPSVTHNNSLKYERFTKDNIYDWQTMNRGNYFVLLCDGEISVTRLGNIFEKPIMDSGECNREAERIADGKPFRFHLIQDCTSSREAVEAAMEKWLFWRAWRDDPVSELLPGTRYQGPDGVVAYEGGTAYSSASTPDGPMVTTTYDTKTYSKKGDLKEPSRPGCVWRFMPYGIDTG